MARQDITVSMYWDRDDPDGSKCLVCEDECWSQMWRAFISGTRQGSCLTLCDSCHEMLMEE